MDALSATPLQKSNESLSSYDEANVLPNARLLRAKMKLSLPASPVQTEFGTVGTRPATTVGVSGSHAAVAPATSQSRTGTVSGNFTAAGPQETAISVATSPSDAGARRRQR